VFLIRYRHQTTLSSGETALINRSMQMSQPNSAEIIARLSEAERAIVAERIVRIERLFNRRSKIVSWLLSFLDDSRIQQRIREIANG